MGQRAEKYNFSTTAAIQLTPSFERRRFRRFVVVRHRRRRRRRNVATAVCTTMWSLLRFWTSTTFTS